MIHELCIASLVLRLHTVFAALQGGRPTFMGGYGAPAEMKFFAVEAETFFERPRQLKREQVALSEVPKDFHRRDFQARVSDHSSWSQTSITLPRQLRGELPWSRLPHLC